MAREYNSETGSTFKSARNGRKSREIELIPNCLLYTSDAADEEDSVDLGGRRIAYRQLEMLSIRKPSASNLNL